MKSKLIKGVGISNKGKGLTRSLSISSVTFDGPTNLFPMEENGGSRMEKEEREENKKKDGDKRSTRKGTWRGEWAR